MLVPLPAQNPAQVFSPSVVQVRQSAVFVLCSARGIPEAQNAFPDASADHSAVLSPAQDGRPLSLTDRHNQNVHVLSPLIEPTQHMLQTSDDQAHVECLSVFLAQTVASLLSGHAIRADQADNAVHQTGSP